MLDPDLARFIAEAPAMDADSRTHFDPVAARGNARAFLAMLNEGRAAKWNVATRNLTVGIRSPRPARLYTPNNGAAAHPGVVYFHGGGWVIGDLETHDIFCRRLASETEAAVLAVDYRLAPEHRFPAANDDATDALRDVLARPLDFGMAHGHVGVGGDSAGATLATAAAQSLHLSDATEPAFQLLVCPGSDMTADLPSRSRYASGYFFTLAEMELYASLYVPDDVDRRDARVSPLLANDLSGLPPTIIATAGFDPLRDDGVAYAEALARAGVAVHLLDEPAMIHGYILLDGLGPGIAAATARVSLALRGCIDTLPTPSGRVGRTG